MVAIFLGQIKRKYLNTFYSIESGRQYILSKFADGTDENAKILIFGYHEDLWTEIRDDVKAYTLSNWQRWSVEKPAARM